MLRSFCYFTLLRLALFNQECDPKANYQALSLLEFLNLNLFPMRSLLLSVILTAVFFPASSQAQGEEKNAIEVSSAVLKTAEWANFKYMETLESAKTGDRKAVRSFLDFSSVVDGTESLQHATTCIELISFAGDEIFGTTISNLKPKLKTILLSRFQLAQGRTQKVELQKPLHEWAPLTWKALNGQQVVCGTCMHEGGVRLEKPGTSAPKPGTSEPTAPDNATGKQ